MKHRQPDISKKGLVGLHKCRPALAVMTAAVLLSIFCLPMVCSAATADTEKTLILYYSRTGKSKIVCDTLKQYFNADALEITEKKDRSGTLGFLSAAFDSFMDRPAEITPANPALNGYDSLIIVSPIWNWNICVPIRTLIATNNFASKKLIMFTTANIDIKKYEPYGDDAPFTKRFFRDYLRKKSMAMRELAAESGADIRGHFHVSTKDVTESQIREDTLQFIRQIVNACRQSGAPGV